MSDPGHRKQLTGILNTKERKNEAEKKRRLLVVKSGGDWSEAAC